MKLHARQRMLSSLVKTMVGLTLSPLLLSKQIRGSPRARCERGRRFGACTCSTRSFGSCGTSASSNCCCSMGRNWALEVRHSISRDEALVTWCSRSLELRVSALCSILRTRRSAARAVSTVPSPCK
uniref:Secreted peptide n=1 Tax=Rhipicephalus pulchellus TaxID=72859 RepID=L7LYY6_RHIPC